MRNIHVWVFGMVFIGAFIFLALNSLEFPCIIIVETKEITGKIININLVYGIRGRGYEQNVDYVYLVDNRFYTGKKNVNKRYGLQNIGNRVKLKYSVKKPHKKKVLGFYPDFIAKKEKRLFSSKEIGYNQITLINNIFNLTEYADSGKVIKDLLGEFYYKNDTLIVNTFQLNSHTNKIANLKFQSIYDSTLQLQLIDIETKMIYKE